MRNARTKPTLRRGAVLGCTLLGSVVAGLATPAAAQTPTAAKAFTLKPLQKDVALDPCSSSPSVRSPPAGA